jgi:hypothetical protein
VSNIVEKFNLVKKHKGFNSNQYKQTPANYITTPVSQGSHILTSRFDQNSALASAGDDEATSFVIR